MEFQAYASPFQQQKAKPGLLWQAQSLLHRSDSVLFPCALLLAGAGLVLYEHVQAQQQGTGTSVRNFMAMIVVTMLPLGFLEKAILGVADPVGAISKFSGQVLLLHACFLAVRVPEQYFAHGLYSMHLCFAVCGLVAALGLLVKGPFRSAATLRAHRETVLVVVFALAGAILTEVADVLLSGSPGFGALVLGTLQTGALYIELLAFMPAVWTVYRAASQGMSADAPAGQTDPVARSRTTAFIAFVLGFYVTEDIFAGLKLVSFLPLATAGHFVHFVMLLDFAGFALSHLYNTDKLEKLMGRMRQVISDAYAV